MTGPGDNDTETDTIRVVERNISALLARKQAEEQTKGRQERIAAAITRFTGSMLFVYIHIIVFGMGIAVNFKWLPTVPHFNPGLDLLAMIASVEAIFLSTFVLISQNRMQAMADRRAELSLHISLLAEHEITRIITLVIPIAKSMGVQESHNPDLEELAKDVAPEHVLDRMNEVEQRDARHKSPKRS